MEKTELKQLMMTTVCPYLKSELVVILRVIFQALYFSVGIHLIWKYNVLWTDTQPYQPTKHFANVKNNEADVLMKYILMQRTRNVPFWVFHTWKNTWLFLNIF